MKITNYVTTEANKVSPTERTLIVDASGSMYYHEDTMRSTLKAYISKVNDLDTINIVTFSTEGNFNASMGLNKHSAISVADSYQVGGLTCYSSPINFLERELVKSSMTQTLVLFTDGQYVGNHSTQDETNRVTESLQTIAKSCDIARFDIVGFGQYYSEQFLNDIQDAVVGSIFHHTNVNSLVSKFESMVGDVQPAMIVPVTETHNVLVRGDDAIYLKNATEVSLYSDRQMLISFDDLTNVSGEQKHTVAKALYKSGMIDEALTVVHDDKAVIDAVTNAFTNDEKVDVESAFNTPYSTGIAPKGYLPTETSPCVFDALLFLENADAKFYPYSKNVAKYVSTGTKVDSSNEIFVADEDMSGSFTSITYTKGRLNISVKASQLGHVKLLPSTAKRVGLNAKEVCTQHRNFLIVNDGLLNFNEMHVSMSNESAKTMKSLGYDLSKISNENFVLKFPNTIFNRKYLRMDNSAEVTLKIASLVKEELDLMAKQKSLNHLLKESSVDKGEYAALTKEQIDVLKDHGVNFNRNYVAIASTKYDATDVQVVRDVKWGVKGVSSLPSIADLSTGKMTPRKQVLNDQYQRVLALDESELETESNDTIKKLSSIRNNIWLMTVITLSSGRTFEGLSDKGEIDIDGTVVSITATRKEKKV